MKKLLILFVAVGSILVSGCQGDDGRDGYSAEAGVIEISDVDFLPNSFAILYQFPSAILQSDHLLVYRLSAITPQGADVWQLLPQYYYFPDGTLDFGYNYDFTQNDVNVFIEGNDLLTLDSQYTQDQILRFVVIPGQFTNRSAPIDTKDYNAVVKFLGLEGKPVTKVTYKNK